MVHLDVAMASELCDVVAQGSTPRVACGTPVGSNALTQPRPELDSASECARNPPKPMSFEVDAVETSFESLGEAAVSEAVLESAVPLVLPADDAVQLVRTNALGVSKNSIFDKCLDVLRSASWPAMGACRGNATLESCVDVGCWNFGVSAMDDSGLTEVTQQLPDVITALNALLRQVWPDASWNTVCVRKNCMLPPCKDGVNAPKSPRYTLSLGDFQGGQLWLADPQGDCLRDIPGLKEAMRGRVVLTHNSPFSFDGHCWRATQPFSGECWVITCLSLPVGSLAALHGFGFPYGPQIQDAVPVAPQEPELALPQAPQFFLDLFSGGHSPLANAARAVLGY